ncbi:MAG: FAD-binding oxidoreductase [Oscillochloridaceae bacterium umkhey_bin13]
MTPAHHIDTLRDELRRTLGPHAVLVRADDLATYDADASMLVARTPALVVLPSDPAQAAAAVRLALAAGLPVVARGAGTGIAGGAVPVRGGMVLSTARMDRVETLEPRSRRAVVGPGVVNADLNAQLAPLGLQFAPDPSSQKASTIGGNLATNAGGPHCLKYGVTSNHILAVELARPDGSLVWTSDGISEWAGYDLTGLVVGSEGTFGPVTRAIVRLTPLPEAVRVVQALFPSVIAASAAVSRVIAAGLLPTSLEVMDHNAIRAVNGAYSLGLPEAEGTTLLIIEVDGVVDGLDATLADILAICRAEGAFELRPARDPADQARLWAARKAVAGAIGRLAPAYLLVDTVVPRTRLPLMMEHVERLRHEYQMEVCNVFHAGDGNLHPLVLYDPRDADQTRRAHAIASAVLKLSIEQGGVITGEHGVGLEKQAYLPLLFSPAELALQATVYQVFNPGDQFNPAKIFPTERSPLDVAAERQARLQATYRAEQDQDPFAILRQVVKRGTVQANPSGGFFVTPSSLGELSATVAACHRLGLQVHPTGSAAAPANGIAAGQVQVSTSGLTQVLAYEPDDLTITVEAGTTLDALRATLVSQGQDLPLELAGTAHTTLGALVATAADGPRRLGYGSMRDWVIGMTIIEADGTVARLGAQVVKNATGYDLVKLLVGSRGSLGLIATVSLRVFPRPQTSATCALSFVTRQAAFGLIESLLTTRLLPTAVEYLADPATPHQRLLIRAEGHPAAVARHVDDLQALANTHGAEQVVVLADQAETDQWMAAVQHGPGGNAPSTNLIRLCTKPADLCAALDHAEASALQFGLRLMITARVFNGVAYLHVEGDAGGVAALHQTLFTRWGHAQLLDGPALAHATAPIHGQISTHELQYELKRAFDPTGTWPTT